MTKGNQRAQSEHLQRAIINMFKCSLVMLKLMLRLFQENKSYGVKIICIHHLMYITACHCVVSGTIRLEVCIESGQEGMVTGFTLVYGFNLMGGEVQIL